MREDEEPNAPADERRAADERGAAPAKEDFDLPDADEGAAVPAVPGEAVPIGGRVIEAEYGGREGGAEEEDAPAGGR